MSSKTKTPWIIILTILYSGLWFCCLLLIFGFFMPTPVVFCKKINSSNNIKSKTTSKHGLSDDKELDTMMFYDTMDEN